MKQLLGIAILFLGLFVIGCASDQSANSVTTSASREYTTTEIGMPLASFGKLCNPEDNPLGRLNKKDKYEDFASASGKTYIITLTDDLEKQGQFRADRGCVGIFTFRDGVLATKFSTSP